MPGVERFARLTHEQFTNVASSELTLAQWVGLSKRINEVFASDKELAGIVVTSGTDTLEETAFFLHLTVRDPRPVVVVGSMRNPSTVGYEGAANLLEGVRVAADPASRNKGALVVLNDEINSARNVTKTDALRAANVPQPRIRPARRRRSRSRGVLQPDHAAAQRADRVRHHQGQRAAARGRDHGLSRRLGRLDQGGGRQRREGHRDCGGRRGRDQRHAERGPRATRRRKACSSSPARAPAAAGLRRRSSRRRHRRPASSRRPSNSGAASSRSPAKITRRSRPACC